ncbi:LOW QUALITY PROTEIN: DBF4-type zinc finger-containing protein 2 [Simochromis diagramma]|uniref:LOW QUALITY PROTEIN: DBF4-type zinc finger-containing protein 2 n=1 Tax=Simochromis diagramma TaxID=43689 RepID=UPI001A7EE105|nr:LOW QUALITY PROTEIN: DBF4-type zinc finger-containing protein 2 [Simochromis diagramma]
MSDSSDEDDQRKAEPTSRMWAESQPGPSRCQPSRQGYCGYCRVLYRNLDQHLSSLRHLDSVRASSRGSGSTSASGRNRLTLLERFLEDVLQHHPHRYDDPRPSHTDLPSVSTPPLPKAELDEVRLSDDSRSQGTRECLPSSDDASCHPARPMEEDDACSQSGDRVGQERLSVPIREQDEGIIDHTHSPYRRAPASQLETPPPVHRKAHRKTNRRKTSESSSSSQRPGGPGHGPRPHLTPTDHRPGPGERPWLTWQRERREAHREDAFSSGHTDPLDQTIEEQAQTLITDVTLQVVLQRARTLSDTPAQVSQAEGRDLCHLMDTQVDVEDRVYSQQLHFALHGPGDRTEEGFWTLPIEEVRPAPERIPESFRGKTWTQIQQEDEEKVERLVRQFRRGRFICYFDTESLARYGRRSQKMRGDAEPEEVEPDAGMLPLLDPDEGDYVYMRRRRGRRRSFRLASRCQVVKVSHSTQTVRLVVPAVHQLSPEAPPIDYPQANPEAAERTPLPTWRSLPSSYSSIITPVQPRTSLVYLLSSPSGSAPNRVSALGSTHKRCRKKRRPLEQQGLKVKYKRLPVRFYDPASNRILKNPPRGLLWRRGSTPSGPPPPCVRQLFRSLSPDLNTDRTPTEVKGHSSSLLLSTLSRDSAQSDITQAPPLNRLSESRRGARRERALPPPSQIQTRGQATPLHPRREGLRRAGPGRKPPISAGPAPLLSSRRRRGRRSRR